MHFSKVSNSRSICINGDWDNVILEITLQDGESLTKAEDAIEQKIIEWETKKRTTRSQLEPIYTKVTDIATKFVNKDQEEASAIAAMFSCKTFDELENYQIMSKSHKILADTYNMMQNKLSKPKKIDVGEGAE